MSSDKVALLGSSYKHFNYDSVSKENGQHVAVSVSAPNYQQVTYSWHNINVFANVQQGNCCTQAFRKTPAVNKQILNNVSGVVNPGEFLAIMGASGAGKTTLLNVLTMRNVGALKIKGTTLLNGAKVDADTLTRISAYVQQDDLFIGSLTVREHLRFQALLRMDEHLSYKQRMERVEEVLHDLGLTKCADTVIGEPGRVKGVSGGERKRLAFASEVLTNPPLMFCDEPTSGLDSYMAQNVVQVLKNLASSGKTVICTIHQPSSEVFAMFDRILLMGEGRVAFLGPVDRALDFFSSQGLPCPANYNPADFYVHTLATVPGEEVDSRKRLHAICDAYDAMNVVKQQNVGQVSDDIDDDDVATKKTKSKSRSPYKANWFRQFSAVLWRSWISLIREPQVLRVKIFQTVFISGLIALIYQGQTMSRESVMNINGVLFVFLTNMTFQNVFGVVNVFTAELPIFLREHFNGMYRTDVYFLSKTLAELPFYLVFPFLFIAIPYYAIGLNPAVDRFFIAAAIVILVANTATSFGYFVSCLTSSTTVALALAAPLIIPMLLFGGFFLNNGTVPVYFDWLKYLSWFMYANEALNINQWTGVTNITCRGDIPLDICHIDGEDILRELNFDPNNFARNLLCLGALIIGLRILGFAGLLSKTYRLK